MPGLLQVQRQAFLGAVDPHKMRGLSTRTLVISAGKIAISRAFHLDDTGAQIGQLAGAKSCGNRVFQRHHGDVVQGSCTGLGGVVVGHQNDLGRPSTCSATYEKIRLVEMGATW